MKKLILSTLLMSALSANAYAQDYDPQKALAQAAKAGACIEKLDKNLIQEMTRKGQENQLEMERLCAAGKRQQAQEKNLYYYKSKVNDPNYSEMKKCMLLIFSNSNQVEEDPNVNICDSL